MEIKKIEQIIQLIKEHNLSEIEIEENNARVRIRAGSLPEMWSALGIMPATAALPKPVEAAKAIEAPVEEKKKGTIIRSPMVGTFYRSPGPDKPSYVEAGSEVKKGDALCVIEAMKLMNEIESTVNGKILAILVDNAKPVEFDQPLFEIEPKDVS